MREKKNILELTKRTVEEYAQLKKRPLTVLLDNVRSLHNVGSLFRTADALAIEKLVLAGITGTPPHPELEKTALGAEKSVSWDYVEDALQCVKEYKEKGYTICVLEQAHDSVPLHHFEPEDNCRYLLVIGNEVSGVDQRIVDIADYLLEIPQEGIKHSLNVSVSAAMAIWQFMRKWLAILLLFIIPFTANANNYYKDYIETYSDMAIEQQKEYGIPASITLAQGLLESAAGRSTLAREGNNHFGIKCHKEWRGKTMLRDDDAPDECFRVYDNVADSYRDHSEFLSRKRYASLFDIAIENYAEWAKELKKCGYATDPNYAARLITIIENYALYVYDSTSGKEAEETAQYIMEHLMKTHPIRRARKLQFVVALPGDTYKSIAKEFGISEKKILKFNDVSHNGKIKEWQEVYLCEKHEDAPEGIETVTIGEGESMHSVAQRYGMKLQTIKNNNKGVKDKPGTVLKMR